MLHTYNAYSYTSLKVSKLSGATVVPNLEFRNPPCCYYCLWGIQQYGAFVPTNVTSVIPRFAKICEMFQNLKCPYTHTKYDRIKIFLRKVDGKSGRQKKNKERKCKPDRMKKGGKKEEEGKRGSNEIKILALL